jgi:hypothetical protein
MRSSRTRSEKRRISPIGADQPETTGVQQSAGERVDSSQIESRQNIR